MTKPLRPIVVWTILASISAVGCGRRTSDLVFTVQGGEVRYYVDGELRVVHSGRFYPESEMSINFNLWFTEEDLLSPSRTRTYIQEVDWVYHAADVSLSPETVTANVEALRGEGFARIDTL